MPDGRTDLERWFIRRGVPHFVEPYAAGSAIWTRAAPLLVVAYLAGGLNSLDLDRWSWQRNIVALAVTLLVLVGAWIVANVSRRRPALSRPTRIGGAEIVVFLVGPTIPPLLFSQWGDALQSIVEGAAVLVVIYLTTSYGLLPLARWAGAQTFAQLGSVGRTLTRALPLLLLFTTFLFINAEVWQVAGTLDGPVFAVVLGSFFVLGSAFVLSRLPAAIDAVNDFRDWAEVRSLVVGTPAESISLPVAGDPSEIPLSRRQRLNIGLISVLSQAILVTIVALSLAGFFLVFGFLAVPAATVEAWTGGVDVLATIGVGSRDLVVTEQSLRVAAFLGAFSGMYFTVVLGTDATYRDEFLRDAGPEIRQALAVRLAYRHSVGGTLADRVKMKGST